MHMTGPSPMFFVKHPVKDASRQHHAKTVPILSGGKMQRRFFRAYGTEQGV
jgi:hypothetical protein